MASETNGVDYIVPCQIDGKEVNTSTTYDVVNPATGKIIHRASGVSVDEAIDAVKNAQAAFPAWRNTPPNERRDIFLRAAEIMARRKDELAKYMMEETGAAPFWVNTINVPLSCQILKDVAGRTTELEGKVANATSPAVGALVYQEPYGVILAIAPWNAAYILGIRSIAYAIAAGNTAVLKAPEFSPRCSWAIGSIFKEAGLPDGVLNVISHHPKDAAAVTKAIIEHPFVKKVNFTGSTLVGRIIAETAAHVLKPVLLELGGKAPAIVLEDADLLNAATWCARGAFLHSGQICMSTEKIIVHKSVINEFVEHLKKVMKENHADAVVLINEGGVTKNKKLLSDATSKGAELLNGSLDTEEITKTRMQPLAIRGVTDKMDLYHTESFGPTVSILETDSEEEAIRLANDTEYGLTSAVFTKDLRRAFRIAKQIEAGAVHINSMSVHDEAGLPHGGMKNSGYGRFGSVGMSEWVRTKTVTFDA